MVRNYKPKYIKKMEEYLVWLKDRNRADVTIVDYRLTLMMLFKFLRYAKGLSTMPSSIGPAEVRAFMEYREKKIGAKYLQTQVRQIKVFLEYCGNYTIRDMGLRYSQPPRPNVTWLTQEEAMGLIEACQDPLEEMIVHLGLELGIRRIGMMRLRVQDFHNHTISVLGKGINGGKWRTIPYHPETSRVLERWMERRAEILKDLPTGAEAPDGLFIYRNRAWGVGAYSSNGLKRVLDLIVARASIKKCTFHTMRRTFGRTMYFNGIEIEKIAGIMGHSDTKTTLLYLGINLTDMAEALEKGSIFRREMSQSEF